MSEALVLDVVREAIQTAVIISLPMLVVGLIVGIAVSIVQTVTSVQDNILAFLPRAAAIFIVFAFTFPWMLRVATGFTAALVRRLPELVR
jgi:flagellar biosynthetic protein FliQ